MPAERRSPVPALAHAPWSPPITCPDKRDAGRAWRGAASLAGAAAALCTRRLRTQGLQEALSYERRSPKLAQGQKGGFRGTRPWPARQGLGLHTAPHLPSGGSVRHHFPAVSVTISFLCPLVPFRPEAGGFLPTAQPWLLLCRFSVPLSDPERPSESATRGCARLDSPDDAARGTQSGWPGWALVPQIDPLGS